MTEGSETQMTHYDPADLASKANPSVGGEPGAPETPLPGGASAPPVSGEQRAAATEQTYTVLAQGSENVGGEWVTVGQIVVAPRTRRATVLGEALAEYPDYVPPVGSPPRGFMVIDADNAEVIPVASEPPPPSAPVLRIGG